MMRVRLVLSDQCPAIGEKTARAMPPTSVA
jgi:rRNA maturation protein Nop10